MTRERLLQQGVALMSHEGLAGVTLGRIAERAEMSKSGVFAHFKSKEEVQISLLEYTTKVAYPIVIEPALAEPEGLPRLEALVRNWFGWAPRAGLPGGCPIAAAMFELDDLDGPVRDKVVELEAEWRGLLRQSVERAVEQGELRAGLDAEQFVWELCGIYLMHHAGQRFLRRPDADERGTAAWRGLVERSRPEIKPAK